MRRWQPGRLRSSQCDPSAETDVSDRSYSDIFKDHLANPRNARAVPYANVFTEDRTPVCGARLRSSQDGAAERYARRSVRSTMFIGPRLQRRPSLAAAEPLPARKELRGG